MTTHPSGSTGSSELRSPPTADNPTPALTIEAMTRRHFADVQRIHAAGIATGHATFETEPPCWEDFDAVRLQRHRLVAVVQGQVVGWAAVSAISRRPVYAGVVEHSVFVDPVVRGAGVGRSLLLALITSTEAAGIWTIQAGIFPENVASLRLHHDLGFRRVGVRRQIGRMTLGPMADQWRDVVLLERRVAQQRSDTTVN